MHSQQSLLLAGEGVSAHVVRLLRTCWQLGELHDCAGIRKWLHMAGLRGHFASKSRCYSTTLGAIRGKRRAYRQRQAAERARLLGYSDPDEVDTTRARRAQPQHVQRTPRKPALRTAGVEPTRDNGMHALRHFYASVLLDAGENIKALSEYLGHANPGFTLRTYTHLMPFSEHRTRRAIDNLFDTHGKVVAQQREAECNNDRAGASRSAGEPNSVVARRAGVPARIRGGGGATRTRPPR